MKQSSMLRLYSYEHSSADFFFHYLSHDFDPTRHQDSFPQNRLQDYRYEPDLFRLVSDPTECDFMTFGSNLWSLIESRLGLQQLLKVDDDKLFRSVVETEFRFFRHHERKHVFFDNSDFSSKCFESDSIFIRTSFLRSNLQRAPRTFLRPVFVQDFQQDPYNAELEIQYDVFFMGCIDPPEPEVRQRMWDLIRPLPIRKALKATPLWFPGNQAHHQGAVEYAKKMKQSLLILCPRGIGNYSHRCFEAMSAGRVPVIIQDDLILPFEGVIDYDKFVFQLPCEAIDDLPFMLADILDSTEPEELLYRGALARQAWEDFLRPQQQVRMICSILNRELRRNDEPLVS